ncbi:keratin, type I cytoskeletal 10-like [Rhagoletis pomonella]|uniref:keratin, type I cytoskeletal 10-like n=1 Tax=Rhagoletis pomonella TaxID=28610 RepID=UPI001785216D|nr:keratin, type I cytoskeletal 10-like [Rhagoletis pomonella]
MAFSTQKEFFHVPFMNETVDYECRRACVKLKTYQSTTDDRSWAMDESLQSRFLSDLVTCQTPVGGFGIGDDDEYENDEAGPAGGQRRINRNYGRGGDGRGARGKHADDGNRYSASAGIDGDVGSSGPSGSGRGGGYAPQYGYRNAAYIGGGGVGHGAGASGGGASGGGGGVAGKQGQGGLVTADSVLACANEQMGRLQDLLLDKQKLEKQLEVSNERLKVANMENDKIKAIMNDRFDSNHAKDFYNKIQKLATSGKINRSEENELLHIYNKIEDMNKAYEVLQAENAHLKRLMEKLSLRASYEAIKMEPEKSNDVPFLQNEVNKLRQEVSMLRKYEDDKLKGRTDSNRNKSPDVDPETLKATIKERNALREKCKTFKELEARVYELQKIANEADKMSDSLSNDLDNQSKHIVEMEQEMKQMQDYYEDQMDKLKYNEDVLKCKLEEMKEDLIRARCSAQKAECLQMEISCLRNELMRRDRSLNDYDCQYKQLMYKAQKFRNSGYCMCYRNPDAGHDNDNSLSDS